MEKCKLFQEEIEFWGHRITRKGVSPTKERIVNLLAARSPRNKGELKSFKGLMTYNVKLLPSIADVLHPLYHLLRKDVMWLWGKKQEQAFTEVKQLVCRAPMLAHYNVDAPIKLYCDAFAYGVGPCLMLVIEGKEKPVVYASWVLTPAETNYTQIEREALSIILGVKKFHQYLCRREFTLATDHQPLCQLLGQ